MGDVVEQRRVVLFLHARRSRMLYSAVSPYLLPTLVVWLGLKTKRRLYRGSMHQEGLDRMARIVSSLGPRAHNSILSAFPCIPILTHGLMSILCFLASDDDPPRALSRR